MFRKIASNREPGITLGTELKKEFGEYFDKCGMILTRWVKQYPKQVFGLMIAAMLSSGMLAFTVMRKPAPPQVPLKVSKGIADPGMGSVLTTASILRSAYKMEGQIESLMDKKPLTHQDSITLMHAFHTLDSLRAQLKQTQPTLQKPPK